MRAYICDSCGETIEIGIRDATETLLLDGETTELPDGDLCADCLPVAVDVERSGSSDGMAWLRDQINKLEGAPVMGADPMDTERMTTQVRVLWKAVDTDHWEQLPDACVQRLVEHLVAAARVVQGRGTAGIKPRGLSELFSVCTGYIDDHDPGYVHGLARDHDPQGPSWRSDARDALEKLEAEVAS